MTDTAKTITEASLAAATDGRGNVEPPVIDAKTARALGLTPALISN